MSSQTFEEYAAHQAMNCSKLMYGFESMLAMKAAIDGDYPEATPGMVFGSQYHCLILEPDEFKRTHVVMPNYAADVENVDVKGKRSYSWATNWAEQKKLEFCEYAASQGKAVITRDNFDTALQMIEAIQAKKMANDILKSCHKEITLFGEIEGVEFKARVDLLAIGCLADLKGTNTVNPRLFGSSAARFRYPERMSVYRELANQNGAKVNMAWIIAAQTAKPFDVVVYPLREPLLDEAFDRVLRLVRRYKECKASGVWPGVDGGADYLEFYYPNWAMEEGDEMEVTTFSEGD